MSYYETCRQDFQARGFEGQWPNEMIDALVKWRHGPSGSVFYAVLSDDEDVLVLGGGRGYNARRAGESLAGTTFKTFREAVEHVENGRLCNRMNILKALETESQAASGL